MNDIRPKNLLHWIKYRYLEWRWDRILKKSGWKTWESYFRWNDPDFVPWGYTVKDQLHGYSYISHIDYTKLPTRFDALWGPVEHCEDMIAWCNANCRGKYRNHWERVIQDHEGQYLPNGIGGTDELFFCFKDERDYIMFTLRWV